MEFPRKYGMMLQKLKAELQSLRHYTIKNVFGLKTLFLVYFLFYILSGFDRLVGMLVILFATAHALQMFRISKDDSVWRALCMFGFLGIVSAHFVFETIGIPIRYWFSIPIISGLLQVMRK